MKAIKLSEIADFIMGQSPPGDKCNEDGLGTPLLNGPTEFTSHSPIPVQFTTEPKRMSREGDILFCVRGSTTGRMNWSDQPYAIGRGIAAVRPKEGENYRYFLKYLIENNLPSLLRLTGGSTFPNLTGPLLSGYKAMVPDRDGQKNISGLFSNIDAKIDLNNRVNAELESLARTIYDYWFLQFDFPDAAGRPYRSAGGRMRYDEGLGREVPEGWVTKPLKTIGKIKGGSTPSRSESGYFSSEGFPWITPKDLSLNKGKIFVYKGEISVTEEGLKNANLKVFPKGSVLMTSRAPVGYLAIASNEVTTNQGFKSFVPNLPYSTEFVYFFLLRHMPLIERNASGSTFKEVSGSVLAKIEVLFPAKEVIKQFTDVVSPLLAQIQNLEVENRELAALRDWLLPLLMSGEVRVGDKQKAPTSA